MQSKEHFESSRQLIEIACKYVLFRPPILLLRHFLGIVSLVFSEMWHGARNSYEVVRDRAGFSGKIFFLPQNWDKGPKCQKQDFFNLLENLVINFY